MHARWLLDRAVTEHELGRDLAAAVRDFLGSADPTTAASHLIGGLTASELPTGSVGGLRLEVGGPHGFLLPPLPNHLFARDTSCWVYSDVSLNPMAMPARRRETANLEAIYRFHPLLRARRRCGPSTAASTRTGAAPRSRAATSW